MVIREEIELKFIKNSSSNEGEKELQNIINGVHERFNIYLQGVKENVDIINISRNMLKMAEKIQAFTHQELLVRILQSELEHRENVWKNKHFKKTNFYCMKKFAHFGFNMFILQYLLTSEYLKNCAFPDINSDITMYGNIGIDKSYLSRIRRSGEIVKRKLKFLYLEQQD